MLWTALLCTLSLVTPLNDPEVKEKKRPWSNALELSGVQTGGNTGTTSLGLKNTYKYNWATALLELKLRGLRVQNTKISRIAIPDGNGGYRIDENSDRRLTAENYQARLAYRRTIHPQLFWFSRFDWQRNQFAGIENRGAFSGGIGNRWRTEQDFKLESEYGLDYTIEDLVFEPEGKNDTYAAVNVNVRLELGLSSNTRYINDSEVVANAENNEDFRMDVDNELLVAINRHLALKLGARLRYANEPKFQQVTILGTQDKILFQLDELDTLYTSSLVITF